MHLGWQDKNHISLSELSPLYQLCFSAVFDHKMSAGGGVGGWRLVGGGRGQTGVVGVVVVDGASVLRLKTV